jgi:cell shape-determining protein MreC
MGKALTPVTIVLLILSVVSLILGSMLFGQREVLKARTQYNEQALATIARNIEFDGFRASALVVENKDGLPAMQTALNQLGAQAKVQNDTLKDTLQDLAVTREELGQAIDERNLARAELDDALAEAERARGELSSKTAEVGRQQVRIDSLEQEKINIQLQMDDVNNRLIMIEDELRDTQDKVFTLEQENTDLMAQLGIGQTKALPRGLTGRIVVVNKDWNFVVIDLGSEQGLVSDAEMLIHRDERLIGKVTITGVSRAMAIAELKTDWLQDEVNEGVFVVY